MNNNIVIAIVVLVALFGCACGWLYSLRWRSEVRERLLEGDAIVTLRRLERQTTQPRRARDDRSRGQSLPPSRPPKAKGGQKNKNKGTKAGTGKKQSPKPKQRPPQQGWSPDNQQNGQENTDTDYQNQEQDQDSSLQQWGSPGSAEQPEVGQSTTSTPTATTAALESEWGSGNSSVVDSSAPASPGQASESQNGWQPEGSGSGSGWSADTSNASAGQGWNVAEKRDDDHPEDLPQTSW